MTNLFYVDSGETPIFYNTREEALDAAAKLVVRRGQGVDIYEMRLLGRMEPVKDPVRFVPYLPEMMPAVRTPIGSELANIPVVSDMNIIAGSVGGGSTPESKPPQSATMDVQAEVANSAAEAGGLGQEKDFTPLINALAEANAASKPKRGRPKKNQPNEIPTRAETKVVVDDHDHFADIASDPPSQIVTIAPSGAFAVGEWKCPKCATICFASQRACACGQTRPEFIPEDERPHEYVPSPQKSDEELQIELARKDYARGLEILSHRVGNDDTKCPRCQGKTGTALVNGFKIMICMAEDCRVSETSAQTYDALYGDPLANEVELPKFSGAAEGKSSNHQPEAAPANVEKPEAAPANVEKPEAAPANVEKPEAAPGVAAALAKREEVLSDIARMEKAQNANPGVPLSHLTIPDEEEVETTGIFLGLAIDLPPAEWEDESITEDGGESGGGQLKALNTALTDAGYGAELRHRACIGILGQIRNLESLKELSKAEAHILLTWLDRAGPEDIAELSKIAGPQRVRI